MKRFNLVLLSAAVGLAVIGGATSSARASFVYTVDVWTFDGNVTTTAADASNPLLATAPTYVFNYDNATINWANLAPQGSSNTGLDFIGSTNYTNFVQWVSGTEANFKSNDLSLAGDSVDAFFHLTATWTSSSTSGNITSDDGSTLVIGGTTLASMPAEQNSNTLNFSSNQNFTGAALDLYYVEANGSPAILNFNITGGNLAQPVPEASTWVMLILGFGGVGFLAYRRKLKPELRLA